jgi:hypothetical protein
VSVPLIDEHAAAELRRIEGEAAALLVEVRRRLKEKPGIEVSRHLQRKTAALVDRCNADTLPLPSSLIETLRAILVRAPTAWRTIDPQRRAGALDYCASEFAAGRDPTEYGLARYLGVEQWRTGGRLLADPDFLAEAAELAEMRSADVQRQLAEYEAERQSDLARGIDIFGIEARRRRSAARRDAVCAALTDATDKACRTMTHEKRLG